MEQHSEIFDIKRLGKKEVNLAQQLFKLFSKVFEWENPVTASDAYLKKMLSNSHFLVYAAMDQGKIVGGLTAFELTMYAYEGSEIFIYDIAVAPAYQRKGIGKQLLLTINEYARHHNISNVFVAASEEDPHAIDFYRATGGIAEKVVHFTYLMDNKTQE